MSDGALTEEQRAFVEAHGVELEGRERRIEAFSFGDTPALNAELTGLVLREEKSATCSCQWEWEAEGKRPPEPGDLGIVLDAEGRPCCLIEVVEVEIRRFDEVDEAFAWDEGEDDRTLASWREGHWRYFERVLPAIGKAPSPDMPLVCERFRVVGRSAVGADAEAGD
jgi:uncharacterized protein YhfF